MSVPKIVCTIGPKSASPEMMRSLRDAGMSVARLNGSHSDFAWHGETINTLREVLPEIPILLDIPGRKIRTSQLAHEPDFKSGDLIILTTEPGHDGSSKVSLNNARLHEQMTAGDTIFADDGTLRFSVVEVNGCDIFCRAETDGTLRSRKGINVPHVDLGLDRVTERDREAIAFSREMGIDFVGISFVDSAEHVAAIRNLINGSWPRIVAKIENRAGMENMDSILAAADVVMIDRGDLSVETNIESVVLFQKNILEAARRHNRPVIVATEMLHSMIEHSQPTKAEVSDISNAVLDGCAATMLSGETAVGRYPVESVTIMKAVVDAASKFVQGRLDDRNQRLEVADIPDAVERAAALLCRSLPVTKIIAVTMTGFAAAALAAQQPRQPIIAITNDPMAARACNLLPGVTGHYFDIEFTRDSMDHVAGCLKNLFLSGEIGPDDVILVAAVSYPRPGNLLNMLQIHRVADLIEALKWKR